MIISTFIEERLKQLKPVGAKLAVSSYVIGEKVWVSTISFAGEFYTRVESDDMNNIVHFRGDLKNEEAALMYRNAVDF